MAQRADAVLAHIGMISPSEPLLKIAAALEPAQRRSLDALQVATAMSQYGLRALVTYDRRMAAAAVAAGLRVEAPD